MKTNWRDLGIKDKIALISACLAFSFGWLLTLCAAFIPVLLSEQGILWILGQSLVYSASVFGLGMYFKAESVQMKSDISKHIQQMEKMSIEREKLRHGIDTGEIPEDEDE